jgi:hypothetical protein
MCLLNIIVHTLVIQNIILLIMTIPVREGMKGHSLDGRNLVSLTLTMEQKLHMQTAVWVIKI